MEDRCVIHTERINNGLLDWTFVGVFDGHGGEHASEYVRRHLLMNITVKIGGKFEKITVFCRKIKNSSQIRMRIFSKQFGRDSWWLTNKCAMFMVKMREKSDFYQENWLNYGFFILKRPKTTIFCWKLVFFRLKTWKLLDFEDFQLKISWKTSKWWKTTILAQKIEKINFPPKNLNFQPFSVNFSREKSIFNQFSSKNLRKLGF